MPVQEIIHKYEVGAGRWVLKALLGFIAIIGLAVVYDLNLFHNLTTAEGMDAAQLARNIAEGKGYTTEFVRPLSIYLLRKRAEEKRGEGVGNGKLQMADGKAGGTNWVWPERFPDVANAPVYPVLLAGALKLMPFEYPDLLASKSYSMYLPDLWIAIVNQVLLLVGACLVFGLAKRLLDEPVAWASAAVFVGTEIFWRFTVSGTSTLLLTVIFLGLASLLARLDQGVREVENPPSARRLLLWAAGVGLLAGVGGLTRYAFLGMIVPVVLWMAFLPTPKRAILILTVIATLGVIVSPWLIRNYDLTGTPFGTASFAAVQNTTQFPGDQLERSLGPDFRLLNTSDYWQKFRGNAREMVQSDLPKFGGNWVAVLFLVGLLVPFRNRTLSRLRVFLLLALGTLFVAQAFGRTWVTVDSPEVNTDNLLVILAPVAFIFGVGLVFILLESATAAMRPIILGTFFLLSYAPLLLGLFTAQELTYFPPWIQDKTSRVGERETVMTDIPWGVAWYGDRQSVWLSLKHRAGARDKTKEDFYAMHEGCQAIAALYLSSKGLKSIELGAVAQWVREEGEDEDWTLLTKLATGLGQHLNQETNKANLDRLRAILRLVEQHWVRGDEESWASFLLGIYVNREVPSGFPLKRAPLGLVPEIFLRDSERKLE